MATKDKKGAPAGKGGAKGGSGKSGAPKGGAPKGQPAAQGGKSKARDGGNRDAAAPRDHAGVGLPVPEPRLKRFYMDTVRARLAEQFGFGNPHQIPQLEKI